MVIDPLQSLGRNAAIAVILGFVWGIHFISSMLLLLHIQRSAVPFLDEILSPTWIAMLCQWCAYIFLVTGFHLMEFFITAVYNPTVVSADSFLVNHSISILDIDLGILVQILFGSLIPQLCNSCRPLFDHLWASNPIHCIGHMWSQLQPYNTSNQEGHPCPHYTWDVNGICSDYIDIYFNPDETSIWPASTVMIGAITIRYAYLRHPSYVGFYY